MNIQKKKGALINKIKEETLVNCLSTILSMDPEVSTEFLSKLAALGGNTPEKSEDIIQLIPEGLSRVKYATIRNTLDMGLETALLNYDLNLPLLASK